MKVKVLDAGVRERQALLRWYDAQVQPAVPFWRFLEIVDYDPIADTFTWPDGRVLTVTETNNLQHHRVRG